MVLRGCDTVLSEDHFIMLRRDTRGISMSLVLNWAEELKEIMARGGTR